MVNTVNYTRITNHSPFPSNFYFYPHREAYCEITLNDWETKFLVIYTRPYMHDREREEAKVSSGTYTWEEIYPEISVLGYRPDPDITNWLYTLDVSDIENKYLVDSDTEVYAKYATNCELFIFDDFIKCINFAKEKYHILDTDFKKLWETNYPKY